MNHLNMLISFEQDSRYDSDHGDSVFMIPLIDKQLIKIQNSRLFKRDIHFNFIQDKGCRILVRILDKVV